MYLIIRKGTELSEETRHRTLEAAIKVAEKEAKRIQKEYDTYDDPVTSKYDDGTACVSLSGDHIFQGWLIVPEPKTTIERAEVLLQVANLGIDEFNRTLDDADVAYNPLCEAMQMLCQLNPAKTHGGVMTNIERLAANGEIGLLVAMQKGNNETFCKRFGIPMRADTSYDLESWLFAPAE